MCEFVRVWCSAGEVTKDGVPEKLRPPSQELHYIPYSSIHIKAAAHIEGLSSAQAVWAVKTNEKKLVAPCGFAVVSSKQTICEPGPNTVG